MEYTQEHLLGSEINLVQASTGKRLANYLIDLLVFFVVAVIFYTILALVMPDSVLFEESSQADLLDRIISLLIYGLLMGSIEAALKGKSLGKYITRTRAVNEDGTPISTATAFKRGFIRCIPFCAFSAFGSPCYPWQDKWSNTYVIDEKTSVLGQDM